MNESQHRALDHLDATYGPEVTPIKQFVAEVYDTVARAPRLGYFNRRTGGLYVATYEASAAEAGNFGAGVRAWVADGQGADGEPLGLRYHPDAAAAANYHLTETSCGPTAAPPGCYPASEEEGRGADSYVAPGEWVEEYQRRNRCVATPGTDAAIEMAVRAHRAGAEAVAAVADEPGLADTALGEEVEVTDDDIIQEVPEVPDLPGADGPPPLPPPPLPVAIHREPPPLRPAMAAPRTGARRHLGLHEDFVLGLLTLLFWLPVPAGAGAAPGPNWGASDRLAPGPRAWEPAAAADFCPAAPLSGIGVPFVLPPLDGDVTVDPLPPPPPPALPPPDRLCEQCVRLADACGRALMAQCGLVAQASGEGSAVPPSAWHPLFGGGCSMGSHSRPSRTGLIIHGLLVLFAARSLLRSQWKKD